MKLSTFLTGLSELVSLADDDVLLVYDTSASALKKAQRSNVTSGLDPSGWRTADAMTYASADSPTFTMTCTGDQSTKYYPGMRIKLTQSTGGTKYFIITAVAYSVSTTITLYGGTDYTLNNEAISNPYYSVVKSPAGFPASPAKWTIRVADTTLRSQGSPANSTWYNLGSFTISIPIGAWSVSYSASLGVAKTGFIQSATITLSTANNSETDKELTCFIAGNAQVYAPCTRTKVLTLAEKTSYYLNSATYDTATTLYNLNSTQTAVIEAVCAYL